MTQRISITEHEYAGRKWRPGDVLDVEPGHVHILVALKRIKPEPGEFGYDGEQAKDMSAPRYETREMTAQPPSVKADTAPLRRQYNRRGQSQ